MIPKSLAAYSAFVKKTPENSLSKKVGRKIRELRINKGLVQNNFNVNITKSKNVMCHIEHGYVDIRIEVLDSILNDLGIELVDFFNDPIFKREET